MGEGLANHTAAWVVGVERVGAQLVDFLKRGKPAQMFVGDDAGWKRTLGVLKSSGVISNQKALGDYYTNAFVP